MDLREKKTRRSIRTAFLQLRTTKPLEKITVKELAQLAEISKATFYLHYKDIFDLSESLQNEVIQSILSNVTHPEYYLHDKAAFSKALFQGFYAQQQLIDTLFSGTQTAVLPMRIEQELRAYLYKISPDMDPYQDMLLTYQIQGGHYVYLQHHEKYSVEEIAQFVGEMSQA